MIYPGGNLGNGAEKIIALGLGTWSGVPLPVAPLDVVAVPGEKSITVTWSPVVDAISYNVYRDTVSPVNKISSTKLSGKTSPLVDSPLTIGVKYFYAIEAVNIVGGGPLSLEVSAIPFAESVWLRVYSHVLPRAKAWRFTIEKRLRQFFEGLTVIPSDFKDFIDDIWFDIFPETTREIEAWEKQFGLPDTGLTDQEKIDRLSATWKATGGQSPKYIQDTLQAAGFDVYIHEWWEPGSNPAIARNPLNVLNDGTGAIQYISNDGGSDMQDGDSLAMDGATVGVTGYALVNKLFTFLGIGLSDGSESMQDGGSEAQDGGGSGYVPKTYIVPSDPEKWPFFLYIGGEVFGENATIPNTRKNEFETLCLKICPTQQWLGILVDYV